MQAGKIDRLRRGFNKAAVATRCTAACRQRAAYFCCIGCTQQDAAAIADYSGIRIDRAGMHNRTRQHRHIARDDLAKIKGMVSRCVDLNRDLWITSIDQIDGLPSSKNDVAVRCRKYSAVFYG